MAGLRVPLCSRSALVNFALPHDVSVSGIESVKLKRVLGVIRVGSDVAGNTCLECRIAGATDRCRDVDPVAPYDRAVVGETGNGCLPQNILSTRRIPFDD